MESIDLCSADKQNKYWDQEKKLECLSDENWMYCGLLCVGLSGVAKTSSDLSRPGLQSWSFKSCQLRDVKDLILSVSGFRREVYFHQEMKKEFLIVMFMTHSSLEEKIEIMKKYKSRVTDETTVHWDFLWFLDVEI